LTDDTRRRVGDALVLAGGLTLLTSAFLHWVRRGGGSGLRGHAVVDAVIAVGRDVPGVSATQLTVLWYLVPALGALSWITTGLHGSGSRATRVVAVAAVVAAMTALVVFGRLVGFADLGAGAYVALAGAAALVVGSWVVAPARPRPVPSVRMTDRGR
jgi:hypothetical protein